MEVLKRRPSFLLLLLVDYIFRKARGRPESAPIPDAATVVAKSALIYLVRVANLCILFLGIPLVNTEFVDPEVTALERFHEYDSILNGCRNCI